VVEETGMLSDVYAYVADCGIAWDNACATLAPLTPPADQIASARQTMVYVLTMGYDVAPDTAALLAADVIR
jgi:hypothetical protein